MQLHRTSCCISILYTHNRSNGPTANSGATTPTTLSGPFVGSSMSPPTDVKLLAKVVECLDWDKKCLAEDLNAAQVGDCMLCAAFERTALLLLG